MGREMDRGSSLQFLVKARETLLRLHLTPIKLVYSGYAGLIYLCAKMVRCSSCSQGSDVFRMLKCAICFKAVCEECAVRRYAQNFCSEACARLFLFDLENQIDTEL
jgi:hypothetical protein